MSGTRSGPAVAAIVALAITATTPTGAIRSVSRTVYLMGTLATLTTFDDDRERALATLERLLEAIEATEAELSTWRADSELARLNATPAGKPFHLSGSLCRTLEDVGHLVALTGGAFDPAVGPLIDAWRIRSGGAIPGVQELDWARRESGFAKIRLDRRACVAVRAAGTTLDAGAFGKGEALDRATGAVVTNAPWMVDVGGQIIVSGRPPGAPAWPVDLAHPRRRTAAAFRLELRAGSIATSGGGERDWMVDGTRVGHVLDPRTGHPAEFAGSVTVWHRRALVADVVSTALYVMGPDQGLAWADAQGIAAIFLDARAEYDPPTVRASRAFRQEFGADLR